MEEHPTCDAGIEALPDALLGDILALAGPLTAIGPIATLVSHRWRRIVFFEPRFWPRLSLRFGVEVALDHAAVEPWVNFQLARLTAVGKQLEALRICHTGFIDGVCPDLSLLALMVGWADPWTLRELVLNSGQSGPLPPDAATLALLPRFSQLTSLALWGQELAELPPGLSFAGLQELVISSNRLESLPPALLAATSLRRLYVSSNHLMTLPPGRYLEGLEELDIAYNWLAYLPRSLASATRLRSLVVGQYSPELQLTAADVDSTLARMPLLRSLELRGSRQPEEVWQYLRQRLPHLKINSAGF